MRQKFNIKRLSYISFEYDRFLMKMEDSPALNKRENTPKTKKFVRSHSRTYSNVSNSPQPLDSSINDANSPRFVRNPTRNKNREPSKNMTLSFREKFSSQCEQSQLKILRLEEQLLLSECDRKKLLTQNQHLKERVALLQQKIMNHSNLEQRGVLKENKGNHNLTKLKKQIAESQHTETLPPSFVLQQQNKVLIAENSRLTSNISCLQMNLEELSRKIRASEREQILQETVKTLQTELKSRNDENRQLELRLTIALAKQKNLEHNSMQAKDEELQLLKLKHAKLITQYQSLRKDLIHCQFRQSSLKLQTDPSRSVSLSLSPEAL